MEQRPLPSEAPIAPKKEFRENQPRPSLVKRCFRSCFILTVIILLLLVLGVSWVAAASGILHVPGLSKVFYRLPEPVRKVEVEELNLTGIKNRVAEKISKGQNQVEIFITEGNLTSIINDLEGEEQKLENAQVVIFDEGRKIEVFGQVANSNLFLTAQFNIGKDSEGNFQIEDLTDFKIGGLRVPLGLFSIGALRQDLIRNLALATHIENALSGDSVNLKILDVNFSEGKIIETVSLLEDNEFRDDFSSHGAEVDS